MTEGLMGKTHVRVAGGRGAGTNEQFRTIEGGEIWVPLEDAAEIVFFAGDREVSLTIGRAVYLAQGEDAHRISMLVRGVGL